MQRTINRDEFLKDATLRICSTLKLDEALQRTRDYIAQFIPVDGLFVNIYEKENRAIRTIACSTISEGTRKDVITPLNEEAIRFLKGFESSPGVRIEHKKHPTDSIMGILEAPILGYIDREILALHLSVKGQHLGVTLASALPGSQFSQEDIHLFETLHEPFTMALVNALTYEKTNSLNERLLDNNRHFARQLSACKEGRIVGSTGGLKNLMEIVEQVAPMNNSVLLLGETGVGKEIIANAIHCMSPRKEGPLIKVNCGAIPEELIDSELFGHEKGAFTGASQLKRGRFERADGGTIFLDEIGELPPAAQVRLLRVLQTHEIERVGGTATIPVNIRVIAATHRNLERMVIENKFREDLWFRINVFPLVIPPLRQRTEDIPELVRHFVQKISREMGLRNPPEIADGALEQLKRYSWPGNVREVENVVERALIQSRGRTLKIDPLYFASRLEAPDDQLNAGNACIFPCLGAQTCDGGPQNTDGIIVRLDDAISKHIKDVLRMCKGKVNGAGGAAELLGVNPSTLRNKMNKLGIEYGKIA
ncbi:MAG: sigma 54-interacting transcriptional regulator [Desulfuromonadales bacterium]|nr:sigma 54-interacting transcriptional regulator [Desulfuromonadales bacterium]